MIEKIIVFILSIFIITGMYNCVESFSEKSKSNFILYGLIFLFACLYNNFYVSFAPEIYSFLPMLFIGLISMFYLKCSLKESIFYIMVLTSLGLALDIIIMLTVNALTSFNILNVGNLEHIQLISSILVILWYFSISRSTKMKRKIKNIFKKFNNIRISFLVLLFFIILYFTLAIVCLYQINNQNIILLSLLIVISSLIIIINFIVNTYQIHSLKKTRDLLIKNNEFYINIIDDYRVMKHNLTNKLLGIKTVANKKSKSLIDDLILEYNSSFKNMKEINNIPTGINGIIYEKLYNLDNLSDFNIYIDNKIKSKFLNKISSRSYNLMCESLGVALDNAIEASSKSKEKILFLKLSENDDFVFINIQNTFQGTIDYEKLGKINYSTKDSKNHGLGLYSLIKKKTIDIQTSIRNNVFIVNLKIKKTLD